MILDPPPETPEELRWLWVWEFQAEHDPDKIDVLLEEVARFRVRARYGERNRTKYRVFPVLVVLQGRCPASDARLDMTWRGLGVSHAPLVWNVADDSAQATLAAIETGADSWTMLFWVPLMSGSDDPMRSPGGSDWFESERRVRAKEVNWCGSPCHSRSWRDDI